jgi:hypothetical protein
MTEEQAKELIRLSRVSVRLLKDMHYCAFFAVGLLAMIFINLVVT